MAEPTLRDGPTGCEFDPAWVAIRPRKIAGFAPVTGFDPCDGADDRVPLSAGNPLVACSIAPIFTIED